jgi:hypothetical protein
MGTSNRQTGNRKEGTMNAPAKHRTHDAIGACTGMAGLALLVATVAAGNPIGLGVGAVVGGGFAFGVLACGLKEIVARRSNKRRAEAREALVASYAPASAIIAVPLSSMRPLQNSTRARSPALRPSLRLPKFRSCANVRRASASSVARCRGAPEQLPRQRRNEDFPFLQSCHGCSAVPRRRTGALNPQPAATRRSSDTLGRSAPARTPSA